MGYSAMNIGGLTIGLTCFLFIFLYILEEVRFDKFHEHTDRIYRVMEHHYYTDGSVFTTTSTPGVLSDALGEEIPEVQHAATYTWNVENLVSTEGQDSYKESGIYAHGDLFRILSIELSSGTREELFPDPSSIVISRSLAVKFFNGEDPVGKSLRFNGDKMYTVRGVYRDLPSNSSLQFDYVLPFEVFQSENAWATTWSNNGPRTLVLLRSDAEESAVTSKIADLIKENVEGSNIELFLYSFSDYYLYGNFQDGSVAGGRIDYVWIMSAIALFVLMIACINFMNLSTARSVKRAKEVGIRKSLGANRGKLVFQYLSESMLVVLLAMSLSLLCVELLMPMFTNLIGREMTLSFSDPYLMGMFVMIALLTGLAAGSYPAFYLSSYQAARVLKGSIKTSFGELFVRKGLVVFQFGLSVLLITGTLVMYQQLDFIMDKNLGYENEHLAFFRVESELADNWDTFRQEAMAEVGVAGLGRANHLFMGRNTNTSSVEWPGKDDGEVVMFEAVRVDYDLVETIGFQLVRGRSFSRNYGADSSKVLLNRAAVEVMALEQPIGTTVTIQGEEREVIGVLEDFNYRHLRYGVEPLFVVLSPENALAGFVRLQPGRIQEGLAALEKTWNEFLPAFPFEYTFMDQQYEALYRSETQVASLAKYFGIFAIAISCLGLFGLSIFTAEQRTKEIGIRKVLGARVRTLVMQLSGEFIRLVLAGVMVAMPLAWWLLDGWLDGYSFHVQLSWWTFLLTGAGAVAIAWLTISYHSVKAAMINPVESLRSE